ncbi:TraB/GumN family protein [Rheinheimera baltica]|uniref:TraB/GumN family protein n=1 Tax=Rheinheimera baltica TaxID=67576 RepID=UPI00273F1554|nr:TraB/GumN family protein [Rheinheimera baltica]MDP5151896.1 TraB/GumN family protein [Rheinheimera baltica]MDP5189817.1 TraB/GumN family protein [Rheinheimera baltica]
MQKTASVKKFALASAVITLLSTAPALAETSVWKVSKGDDYLYLGGTLHLLPESAFPLPAEFELAYNDADHLVQEAKLPEPDDQTAQISMINAMSYGNGEKLSDKLSPEVYQQLAAYFNQYGIQLSQLEGYKPSFVSLQMLAIELQKLKMTGQGVDSYFDHRAKQDSKSLQYLESIASQMAMLSTMGDGYENEFIKLNLSQISEYKTYFDSMISAWRQGDLQQINSAIVQPVQQMNEQMYQTMLVKRNLAWLPQIEQMFGNQQRELVLVGAGHLAGQDGVLSLLQAAGYELHQLNVTQ